MDRADARVIERRSGARLEPKALQRGAFIVHGFSQELDRNTSAQLEVDGFIDHTHAALTDPADDLVMPNHRAHCQFVHVNILPVQIECSKQFFSACERGLAPSISRRFERKSDFAQAGSRMSSKQSGRWVRHRQADPGKY
jgi:hypothetical protein